MLFLVHKRRDSFILSVCRQLVNWFRYFRADRLPRVLLITKNKLEKKLRVTQAHSGFWWLLHSKNILTKPTISILRKKREHEIHAVRDDANVQWLNNEYTNVCLSMCVCVCCVVQRRDRRVSTFKTFSERVFEFPPRRTARTKRSNACLAKSWRAQNFTSSFFSSSLLLRRFVDPAACTREK